MTDNKKPEAESKTEETKREKFVRVAQARTNKAMDAIASLRGLTNKANYEFTNDDWVKIFEALDGELNRLQTIVKSPSSANPSLFSL